MHSNVAVFIEQKPRSGGFLRSNLHGINLHGAFKALHTLPKLLVPKMEEGFGALGTCTPVS